VLRLHHGEAFMRRDGRRGSAADRGIDAPPMGTAACLPDDAGGARQAQRESAAGERLSCDRQDV
jgi:hypothetical protein